MDHHPVVIFVLMTLLSLKDNISFLKPFEELLVRQKVLTLFKIYEIYCQQTHPIKVAQFARNVLGTLIEFIFGKRS